MDDARFDDGDRHFTSDEAGARLFESPFLREILNDLTLALDLGRPAFLLGGAGAGKSALGAQVALSLGTRYGVARLTGRRTLAIEDVVEACRQGFPAEAWADLATPRGPDLGLPGANVMIVDEADAIPPRFVEQMIALSNGSPDLLPSHRILLIGRVALVDVIETGRVRNNWGQPLVLTMPPWPAALVAPFLRHRLRTAGGGDLDRLSDAAIAGIAAEAQGNPGRMLDLAQGVLWPDGAPGWIEPPPEPPPMDGPASTIIDLEPVASPTEELATVVFAEPAAVLAPEPPPSAGMLVRLPRGPRRMLQLALPVGIVIAAGLLIWVLDQPPAPKPQQVAVVVPPPPPPEPVPAPPEPVAVAPPPASPPPAAAPAIPVETLIARGDALLAGGDFAAARLFYLQAVRIGSAKAATSVARTYDPLALDRLGVVGGRGEPDKAAEWYRKAADLGDTAALEPLKRLAPQ